RRQARGADHGARAGPRRRRVRDRGRRPAGSVHPARDGPPGRQAVRRLPVAAQARDGAQAPRKAASRRRLMAALRLVFAGTPEFAIPCLEAVLAGPDQLLAVYTQPDRPAGRGRRLQASPVKQRAEQAAVEVRQPVTLRDPAEQDALRALQPDLLIVVAYGLLLPQKVLRIPRHGCWNVHASLLPRWRGAAPIQRALEAGDADTGVCLMQMEKGLDTGP